MSKILKIAASIGIGLALFFLIVLFILYRLIQSGELRTFVIAEIEKQTQLQVKVGRTDLRMGAVVGISFGDFALLDPAGTRPVMTAQKVLARVALLPLLRKKVDFYELRVDRPTLQIHRDQEGRIPELDLIMRLLFEGQKESRFSFDLRGIRIENGEMSFLDHHKGPKPVMTRFRKTDLDLRRVKDRDLLPEEISRQTPDATSTGQERRTVEFSVRTAIEKGGKTAGFKSKGKVVFSEGQFELRQAWLDADIQLEEFPVSGFWDYYGGFLPVKSLQGTLSPRLKWQGRLAERVHIKGEMAFRQLEVEAPAIFANAVSPGDGSLEFAFDLGPQEILVSRLALRSKEINLAAQGRVRALGQEDPYLEVHLTTPFVSLVAARQYVPLTALKSPRLESLISSLNQGEVKVMKAGVSGHLSQIRRFSEPGFENHLWMDAEVRGVGAELKGDRYLPLRGVSGRLILGKGEIDYRAFKGSYGQSQFAEIEGSHKGVLTGQGLLELRVRGDLDLGQLRDQLRLALFPPSVNKATGMLQELSGRGKVNLLLRTDWVSHHYEGRLALENVGLRASDLSLSQVRGEVSFSPKEIRAERLSALLAGSPLTIRALLRNYSTDSSTFDLGIDSPGVKAGAVSRILLSVGSPQDPGTVRGSIRYQGSLASAGERELTGSLELIGAQLSRPFLRQAIRELSGKIILDKRGIDFQALRGRVAGYAFDFSGQWRPAEKPQLTFSLNSAEMDIAHLLPKADTETVDWYDRLQAKGKITINMGKYEGFEFSNLRSDLTIDRRHWHLDNFSARSHGGSVLGDGVILDLPVGSSFSVQPRIQGVPMQGFLKWFDIGTAEITGKVNVTGDFDSSGQNGSERKRNLKGAFQLRVEDGVARRFTVLVRILNLLDLSRWFSLKMPDLKQRGIRFRSVTGDFKVERGVYATQNLFVDSDDLRLSGAGTLDGATGEMDFVIAVRPFPGLDSAVNFIPLIGPGIAAIKNSFLVASFRVKGPIEDPTITPAPLSTLSEFFYSTLAIPKGIIGGSGQEKK
jgi:uncharacterized protein YhdP